MKGSGGYRIKENLEDWIAAVESCDPKRVVELFSEDVVFLPTFSQDNRNGLQETEDYFRHFLGKRPKCTIVESKVITLGANSYLEAGKYDFEVDDGGDDRITVHARFTFVWTPSFEGGVREWKIVHFHSSEIPKEKPLACHFCEDGYA
ncbi:MAG: hypothetical protein QG620_805 [Patescibacteria group bacterium]|nr:hypothetical protein [Patescibacteria group bacterium]